MKDESGKGPANAGDLRVRRTLASIRSAFMAMLREKEYSKISVLDLARRAGISRKTFYLHYDGLGDLAAGIQREILSELIPKGTRMDSIEDVRNAVRRFFKMVGSDPLLHERLLCQAFEPGMARGINRSAIALFKSRLCGTFASDGARESIIWSLFCASGLSAFRQWVEDGKRIPLDDVREIVERTVCNGMAAWLGAEGAGGGK